VKTTLFVAVLFLLALSACGQRNEVTYRVAQFPASDEPLKKWFEVQAGIRSVEISREGNALQVRYFSDEVTTHFPPFGELGYGALEGATITSKFSLTSHFAHCSGSGHGRDCSPDSMPLVVAAPLGGSGGK